MPADDVTLDDIRAARDRIAGGVVDSPCLESVPLSELTGLRVVCKIDAFQRTGSFKERGALNALLMLDAAARGRGVIAASAGNHALGLAFHGRRLGVPVTVVMPTFAPLVKSGTCRELGADVLLHGRTFGEAKARAHKLAAERGLSYVHGFNDAAVIAGQGTMGLEILEQVPDAAAVVVPVGGAGLLAGVATAVKGGAAGGEGGRRRGRARPEFHRRPGRGESGGRAGPPDAGGRAGDRHRWAARLRHRARQGRRGGAGVGGRDRAGGAAAAGAGEDVGGGGRRLVAGGVPRRAADERGRRAGRRDGGALPVRGEYRPRAWSAG